MAVRGLESVPAWLRPVSADLQQSAGLLDAVALLKEEQPDQAAIRLQQLRREFEFGSEVVGLHSWSLLQAGQPSEAATVARDGIAAFGATPALAFAMAEVFDAQGNAAEAFPLYRDLATLAPEDPPTLDACVRSAVALGNGRDALFYLDRLMLLEPLSVEQKRQRAAALQLAGRPSDALALYRQMAATSPDDYELLAEMATASFAAAEQGGTPADYEESVALLERLVAVAPQHADAFFMLARGQQQLGHDAASAAAFDRCLELEPGNVDAGLQYAALLAAGGDVQASADALLALLRQPISGADVERVQSRLMNLSGKGSDR
jgi:tetratricopeptide (TPR) repeat protein